MRVVAQQGRCIDLRRCIFRYIRRNRVIGSNRHIISNIDRQRRWRSIAIAVLDRDREALAIRRRIAVINAARQRVAVAVLTVRYAHRQHTVLAVHRATVGHINRGAILINNHNTVGRRQAVIARRDVQQTRRGLTAIALG